jgi:type VI protein secretion system component Hcp
MQCLIQVFDDKGAAQLRGDSRLKDHIGWLTLRGWSFGETSEASPSGSSSRPSASDREIQLVLRTEDPAMSTLPDAVGSAQGSKATLDCFKDGEDQAWYLRLTLQDPVITSLDMGTRPEPGRGLSVARMAFSASSIDYRDPASKVTYFMPSGAVWDPNQEVCRVFDPDDAVSQLPE